MSEQHGSVIAYIAYAKKECADADETYHRIGALIYYRSHHDDKPPHAQFRLDGIPAKAFNEGKMLIGNFIPSEKVPEPPYIDGDLFAATEERGKPIICGHIHTVQSGGSKKLGEYEDDATQYQIVLNVLPVYQWKKVIGSEEKRSIYLRARIE